jgi:hypothetical protein
VPDLTPEHSHIETYGGKKYLVPNVVDFRAYSTSDYTTISGSSVLEYSESLSVSASVSAEFPGFSGSATADFNTSERSNLANFFTRISYNITHYILSVNIDEIRAIMLPAFTAKLNAAAEHASKGSMTQAFALFDEYGTHLLRSVIAGGRGAFTSSTDSRKYSSEMSIEAAAKISASYLVAKGEASLSVAERQAMDSFNESSKSSTHTGEQD